MNQAERRSTHFLSSIRIPMRHVVVLILAMAVLLGVGLAGDYGESWDEHNNIKYGELYLQAYRQPVVLQSEAARTYFHGPAYLMFVSFTSGILSRLVGRWTPITSRHFITFSVFLAGCIAVYWLAKRHASNRWAAFAALVFGSQPLLFGHAFINLKDIPFMSAFALSIAAGLASVSYFGGHSGAGDSGSSPPSSRADRPPAPGWSDLPALGRILLILAPVLGALTLVDLLLTRQVHALGTAVITSLYEGRAPGLLLAWFHSIAPQAGSVDLEAYLHKFDVWYPWLATGALAVITLVSLGLYWRLLPDSFRTVFSRSRVKWIGVIAAGLALGVTTSIRTAGPFAGLLVSVIAIFKLRRRAIGPLVVYWSAASLAMYATWPALWLDPIHGLISRMLEAADFEEHAVFYLGREYVSTELPMSYLPTLLGIQLTELVWPLALAGGVVAGLRWGRTAGGRRLELLAMAAWFLIPTLGITFSSASIYDNFRQLLFVLPPLFIFIAIAFEEIARRASPPLVLAVAAAAILPGFIAIARNHPYEYAYYNVFVGGLPRAAASFEADYWCTSYAQAMAYINDQAPTGSAVVVWGPQGTAEDYARLDLQIRAYDRDHPRSADYALACGAGLRAPSIYPTWQVNEEITHRGVVLASIKVPPLESP